MKNIIWSILITMLLVGCEIDTMNNGKFDGYWHITKVDTISNGKSIDISENRAYWCVEGRLLQLRYIGKKGETAGVDMTGYYLRFSKSDKELVLSEPYRNGGHEDRGPEGGDTPLDDITPLQRYGIYQIPEHFDIEELTNSKMTLASNTLKIYFVKQ